MSAETSMSEEGGPHPFDTRMVDVHPQAIPGATQDAGRCAITTGKHMKEAESIVHRPSSIV